MRPTSRKNDGIGWAEIAVGVLVGLWLFAITAGGLALLLLRPLLDAD